MNEAIPLIAPIEPPAAAHKDRSTGLLVFGVLTVTLGCLAGLFVLVMLAGQAMAAKTTQVPANFAAILPAIAIYAGLAAVLICLGIGSIQARRWARALLLIFSWSWLLMGIVTTAMMGFIMPKVMANMASAGTAGQTAMPSAAKDAVLVVMFLFCGIFMIVLPAVWIFFYGSRHVKATCERRDPPPCWTDACPLPVLALCLWLLFGVPMMLLMPIVGHGVMPCFGIFLTGLPGTLVCLAVAALWSYAACLIYRLKPQGWWLILIALLVFAASSSVTFARHDLLEMYQLMGYPQAQIDQMKQTGLLAGNLMVWLMPISLLPIIGYLIFVKKYFRAKS
jgi:hypothetical protein